MAQGLDTLSGFYRHFALRLASCAAVALVASRAFAVDPGSALPMDEPPTHEEDNATKPQAEAATPEREDPFNPAPTPLARPDQPARKRPREVNALPIVSTDAPPPLIWKYPTFSTGDWAVTITGAALTLGAAIVKPRPQHSLTGPIGFDEDVRSTLRADRLADRYKFRDASDIGLSLAVSWPFVGDALTAAWWYRGSRETAAEMALINLQTLSIVGAIQGVTNVVVSRERPFGKGCGQGELPSDAIDCEGSFHYRSFFSGHSAFSFTGAALICVHHLENELLGGPWDGIACATGYAVAGTTATFRVVADVHYASDVLLGATIGTLVGFGVPLLHYRHIGGGDRVRAQSARFEPTVNLVPSPGGIGLAGTF
ncbi:MAG: phosphatase PAP2 family protein [Myxococcales bacterium]|nr:MAG: phosphatase PAP2 family protein [Myxococcales bacterium]